MLSTKIAVFSLVLHKWPASAFAPKIISSGIHNRQSLLLPLRSSEQECIDVESDDRLSNFNSLGLSPKLLTTIESQGWEVPTPIQSLAIPAILNLKAKNSDSMEYDGDDKKAKNNSLWAEAPTGSGKTAAFALPLLQLTMDQQREDRMRLLGIGRSKNDESISQDEVKKGFISTLIICPTRELALQIGGVLEELTEAMPSSSSRSSAVDRDHVDIVVITGGTPLEPQIEALAQRKVQNKNVDILVATPGRLVDVLLHSKKVNAHEKELEKRLLRALDSSGKKDVSLSLAQIEELKLNEGIAMGDDGGRSAIQNMLSNVRYLVLDEADRLLSSGFKKEMDEVLKLLPRPSLKNDNYQSRMKTLLFSATFPEQIGPRVEKVLQRLSGKESPPPLRLSCALAGAGNMDDEENISGRQRKRLEQTTQPSAILEGPASTIKLRTIRIEERDRTQALRRLINDYGAEEWDRVLVFVATRYASEHVSRKLRRANIKASELHGKLDQDARIRRLEDFKKGKTRVLVATDLASRGLDVVGLPAVVNYDLPRSTADFTHRIGRTGRAGKRGTAVSFVTPTNEAQFDLIEKRNFCGNMGVEREVLKGFEPDEENWLMQSTAAKIDVPGVAHSTQGLAHDKMFGGVKGRRKSKKDKLREKAAREKAKVKSVFGNGD